VDGTEEGVAYPGREMPGNFGVAEVNFCPPEKKEEKEMARKTVGILGMVVGAILITSAVYGANPDSCEVSCTPVISYSVAISTPADGFALGNVNLNTTYVHSATATIKNNGDASADWKIKGAALDTWTLGSESGADTVLLLGVLKAGLAASGEFDVTNDTITVTEANMDATHYSVDQNGDDVAKDATRNLSIRMDTPTDTSVTTEQRFRIEIKAYVSSTF